MEKIAIINPYFGKFPNYFYLHLLSIEKNPDITWFFFTDDRSSYNWPDNTKVFYMSFAELQDLFQSKFQFPIALKKPYKLCDFKPAYGYIFSEYLKEYEFWGHCDLDVIWGNLKKYLSDMILKNYDLIFREGHLRLYRNIDKINFLFREDKSIFSYKEVFSNSDGYSFDEALSIQRIAERLNIKIYYDDNVVADIDSFVKPLYIRRIAKKRWSDEAGIFRDISNYRYQIFKWENGNIIRYYIDDDKLKTDEFLYIHLMKRKMKVEEVSLDAKCFLILPDKFNGEYMNRKLTQEDVRYLSQADEISRQKERLNDKILRKMKKMFSLTSKQRNIVFRKRFYFIIEKFMFLKK